jgi:biopolymer transport protein ExbD
MRFRPRAFREEPEINFIPLIDVLLVILIFLMVTTTYSRYAELPTADAERQLERADQIDVAVDAHGRYMINRKPVAFSTTAAFSVELHSAAKAAKDPVIVITADANAPHQSVINVMESARIAGYGKITFTTQAAKK